MQGFFLEYNNISIEKHSLMLKNIIFGTGQETFT